MAVSGLVGADTQTPQAGADGTGLQLAERGGRVG